MNHCIESQKIFETSVASAEGTVFIINHIESVNTTVKFFTNIKIMLSKAENLIKLRKFLILF